LLPSRLPGHHSFGKEPETTKKSLVLYRGRPKFVKFSYDPREDVLYFHFKEGPSESLKEIENNVIVELDDSGELMGIEFWNAKKKGLLKQLTDITVQRPE
jgi:uncharacterized protein YuzE